MLAGPAAEVVAGKALRGGTRGEIPCGRPAAPAVTEGSGTGSVNPWCLAIPAGTSGSCDWPGGETGDDGVRVFLGVGRAPELGERDGNVLVPFCGTVRRAVEPCMERKSTPPTASTSTAIMGSMTCGRSRKTPGTGRAGRDQAWGGAGGEA